jgi:TonB family protein
MYRILLILCLSLSSNSFAAKSYTLTIKVISLSTHLPLEGCKVYTRKKGEKHAVGTTNAKGEIVLDEIREKSLSIIAEDPENIHKQGYSFYYNPEREDQTEEIYLRLNPEYEESHFSAVDAKYETDSSLSVNQIPSGKSSISDRDSIEFIPASPVGGVSEFFKFIHMNIEYPQECVQNNIQGKVYISFTVQKDGAITNVTVVKGVHKSLDEEAVRLVRYAPKWNPATSEGRPVKAIVRTPVSFTLM